MPANTSPIFLATANKGITTGLRLTTANTTRDLSATASASLLFSAGSNGSRVEAIDFVHSAASQTTASVAAVGRIFLCSDVSGSNPRLIAEIALPLVTPSATAVGQTQRITFTTPLFIASGQHLWASLSATQTSGAYDITAYGGDY